MNFWYIPFQAELLFAYNSIYDDDDLVPFLRNRLAFFKEMKHLSLQTSLSRRNLTFCIFFLWEPNEDVYSVECHQRKESEHFLLEISA